MYRSPIAALVAALTLASCAGVKQVAVYCEPQSAAIYVDEVYRGNGIVRCDIPRRQKYVTIACSEDGVRFAERRLLVRILSPTVEFRLEEFQRYSSSAQQPLSVH